MTLILWGTLDLLKAYRIHLSSENVELVRTSREAAQRVGSESPARRT